MSFRMKAKFGSIQARYYEFNVVIQGIQVSGEAALPLDGWLLSWKKSNASSSIAVRAQASEEDAKVVNATCEAPLRISTRLYTNPKKKAEAERHEPKKLRLRLQREADKKVSTLGGTQVNLADWAAFASPSQVVLSFEEELGDRVTSVHVTAVVSAVSKLGAESGGGGGGLPSSRSMDSLNRAGSDAGSDALSMMSYGSATDISAFDYQRQIAELNKEVGSLREFNTQQATKLKALLQANVKFAQSAGQSAEGAVDVVRSSVVLLTQVMAAFGVVQVAVLVFLPGHPAALGVWTLAAAFAIFHAQRLAHAEIYKQVKAPKLDLAIPPARRLKGQGSTASGSASVPGSPTKLPQSKAKLSTGEPLPRGSLRNAAGDVCRVRTQAELDKVEEAWQAESKKRRSPEVQAGIDALRQEAAYEWIPAHLRGDEAFLDRFVRGYKCDLEPATVALKAYIKWEQEFKIATMHKSLEVPPAPVRKYKNVSEDAHHAAKEPYIQMANRILTHSTHGRDKDGRPVYYSRIGIVDTKTIKKEVSVQDWLDWHFHHTEHMMRVLMKETYLETGQYVEDSVVIYDLEGLGLAHRHLRPFLEQSSKIDQAVYPERLRKLFVINTPKVFMAMWKVIKMWLDPVTLTKIAICGGRKEYLPQMREWINEEDIPEIFGGSCQCPGGCVPLASVRAVPQSEEESLIPRTQSEENFVAENRDDIVEPSNPAEDKTAAPAAAAGAGAAAASAAGAAATPKPSVTVSDVDAEELTESVPGVITDRSGMSREDRQKLTDEELEAIFQKESKKNRADYVQPIIDEMKSGAKPEYAFLPQHILDNEMFLDRFIRGYKGDMGRCTPALEGYVKWEQDYKTREMSMEHPPAPTRRFPNIHENRHHDCEEKYTQIANSLLTHANHGWDRNGRPVYYSRVGLVNSKALRKDATVDDWLNWHFQHNNHIFQKLTKEVYRDSGRFVEDSVIVYDLKGLGLSHRHLKEYLVASAHHDQIVYPERLRKLFVINTPTVFMAIWKMVKPMLDPVTLTKISILGKDYKEKMLEWIDEEDLPEIYGGKCNCNGGCIPLGSERADPVPEAESMIPRSKSEEDFLQTL